MKRFILYSLSATVALAFGSIAEAKIFGENLAARGNARDLVAQNSEENLAPPVDEGIISPDDTETDNIEVPGEGALEDTPFEEGDMMDPAPTEGVISPGPQDPNNRAVPGPGALEPTVQTSYYQQCQAFLRSDMASRPAPTAGVISPDDSSPYNRAFPRGPVSSAEIMTDPYGYGESEERYLTCMDYVESTDYDDYN